MWATEAQKSGLSLATTIVIPQDPSPDRAAKLWGHFSATRKTVRQRQHCRCIPSALDLGIVKSVSCLACGATQQHGSPFALSAHTLPVSELKPGNSFGTRTAENLIRINQHHHDLFHQANTNKITVAAYRGHRRWRPQFPHRNGNHFGNRIDNQTDELAGNHRYQQPAFATVTAFPKNQTFPQIHYRNNGTTQVDDPFDKRRAPQEVRKVLAA